MVHMNDKYPQFNNISITNLTNKYGKSYDDKSESYITETKKQLIDKLIAYRTSDLKEIHGEHNKNKPMHKNVLKLIDKIETPEDENDDSYIFHKEILDEIIMLFYNKSKLNNQVITK